MPAHVSVERRVGATAKGPSPSSRMVCELVRLLSGTSGGEGLLAPLASHLAPALDVIADLLGLPEGVTVDELTFGGFRSEIVRPAEAGSMHDGVIVYVHGGNVLGSTDAATGFSTHRTFAAQIAKRCGMPVLSVDYRRGSGGHLGRAIDDCQAAYRWLLNHAIDPEKIVVVGDGVGAYLALSMVVRASLAGSPRPAGIVSVSGRFDKDEPGQFLGAPGLFALNGAIDKLPTTLFVSAEGEEILSGSTAIADQLLKAGVSVRMQIWQGQARGFASNFPNLPESQLAISDIARFAISRLAQADLARRSA